MSGYKFNAKEATTACINWIKNWFDKNGPDCNAVIGISGGKDSTVVAKLCVEALGEDRVIGILMPCISGEMKCLFDDATSYFLSDNPNVGTYSTFSKHVDKYSTTINALNDGLKVCNLLGIKHYVANVNDAVQCVKSNVMRFMSASEQALINILPRVRMTTLYAFSQSLNGRVANTTNYSEKAVGWGTRWGDTVGDFAPLAELTCTEVKAIGHELGLPDYFVNRIPDDGLCGKSDEENFGFTYAELDEYLRTGRHITNAEGIDMISRIQENEFKSKPIAVFDPSEFIKG